MLHCIQLCVVRYHLQAFRHMYVLGVEQRVLVSRDWETEEACPVPLYLHYEVRSTMQHEVT